MRVIVLTSNTNGIASRVVPVLYENPKVEIASVVLAHGLSPNHKRHWTRKLRKILRIGILGAINGVRIRRWYTDELSRDIRETCMSLGLVLHETPYINCEETRRIFREASVDLGLSLGNGYIPSSVFTIPARGMVNIHTEILPRFQGAQSVIWSIYEGLTSTGFTVHQIDRKIDTGDILYQKEYPIDFRPTLEETVRATLLTVRSGIPAAFSHVCENYDLLTPQKQVGGKSYTTPSLWSFLTMVRNNRRAHRSTC